MCETIFEESKLFFQNTLVSDQIIIMYEQIYLKISSNINEIMMKPLEINFENINILISGAITLNTLIQDTILSYKKNIEKFHDKKKVFLIVIDKFEYLKTILNIFMEVIYIIQ